MFPNPHLSNFNHSQFSQLWLLDKTVTFLNHGSFGACPLPTLQVQQQLREKLEQEPVHFFIREWEPLIKQSRQTLATFLGTSPDQLVFIPNATTGVNAVLRSLPFAAGDELLTTNQEYNACRNVLDFVAHNSGASIVTAPIPFPLDSPEAVIEAVLNAVSPRTRLALLDHVVSQTALVFPIPRLVQELAARGVDTLVDGSHAPGMIPLNLTEIGAAYYVGNCHKWLCAPKGVGFLNVRLDLQDKIRPPVISHGANSPRTDVSRFHLEFDWMGTDDPTAYLSIPAALELMASRVPGGWQGLMDHNHQLALAARNLLCETLAIAPPCPDDMVGAMASIPLPPHLILPIAPSGIPVLQEKLWEQYQIEVPVIPWLNSSQHLLRISAQIYNNISQYEFLAQALQNFSEKF